MTAKTLEAALQRTLTIAVAALERSPMEETALTRLESPTPTRVAPISATDRVDEVWPARSA